MMKSDEECSKEVAKKLEDRQKNRNIHVTCVCGAERGICVDCMQDEIERLRMEHDRLSTGLIKINSFLIETPPSKLNDQQVERVKGIVIAHRNMYAEIFYPEDRWMLATYLSENLQYLEDLSKNILRETFSSITMSGEFTTSGLFKIERPPRNTVKPGTIEETDKDYE